MWLLCSFQGPWRGCYAGRPAPYRSRPCDASNADRRTPVSQNSTACWRRLCPRHASPPSRRRLERATAIQPGSVDVLGPVLLCHPRPPALSRVGPGAAMNRGTSQVLPRKEVIQPQLPLRLPCYDFTPVTSPTFDGSLPKGLGHRLRVLLTPVV